MSSRMGLKAGQAKMSKSDPDSAVFMEAGPRPESGANLPASFGPAAAAAEDTPEDVRRKITNAACPRPLDPVARSSPPSAD